MNISKGILNEKLGHIKPTPSKNEKSHHTWWIPENTTPDQFFELIDTIKKENPTKT